MIYISVIIGVSLIIFYVFYYITTHYEIPSVPSGQYNLIKITQTIGDDENVIEEYSNGEYYITTNKDLELESHSQDKGIVENEIGYGYILHADELVIFLSSDDADIAYTGHYYEESKQIKISYKVDEIVHNFYYQFVEPAE